MTDQVDRGAGAASDNPPSRMLSEIDASLGVTAGDIALAVKQLGIRRWSTRSCSICQELIGYVFADGAVAFDSNCGCTRYTTLPQPRSAEDLSEHFNRQAPEVRIRLWDDFLRRSEQAGEARS